MNDTRLRPIPAITGAIFLATALLSFGRARYSAEVGASALTVTRALTLASPNDGEAVALELSDGERYLWDDGAWYDVHGDAVAVEFAAELTALAATADDPRFKRIALLEHMMGIGTQ